MHSFFYYISSWMHELISTLSLDIINSKIPQFKTENTLISSSFQAQHFQVLLTPQVELLPEKSSKEMLFKININITWYLAY